LTTTNLNEQIKHCRKCRLWKETKNAVPGEGPINAKVMLVGQNPGSEEDVSGRPFVGRAGKFLTKVLTQNDLNRQELFITNIVKHATPKNRKPLPDEIECCLPYLIEEIMMIKPQIVVLMGTLAWQTPRCIGVKYYETVHPSAAMRFTKMRKRFLNDFEALKKYLQENCA
jgi:uracil-DNA glycosylase family 4